MTARASDPAVLDAPRIGFMGWGASSVAVAELVRRHAPARIAGARLYRADAASALQAPLDAAPSVEALFNQADLIFVEGNPVAIARQLPVMRLAISDRHVLVLLGHDWSLDAMLQHLHERKLMRCLVRTFGGLQPPLLAYVASTYVSAPERAGFRRLFGDSGSLLELPSEQQFEVVYGLAEIAPAAFHTIMDAMADGALMMGLPRGAALKLIASALSGTAEAMGTDALHAAQVRDQALQSEVAAAGLLALEGSGARGLMMRVVREATRRPNTPHPHPSEET